MPDLAPLPPLGPTPAFAPSPDRFAAARGLGRRRRAVRTSLPLGAAVLVAAVTVAGAGAGGSSGLRPDRPAIAPPRPSASARTSATPDARPVLAASGPRATPSPAPADAVPTAVPADRLTPSPEPPPPTRPPGPATLRMVAYDGASSCVGDTADQVNGWCMRALVPATLRSGAVADLVFDFCRTESSVGQLWFPDGTEITFTVSDSKGVKVADRTATTQAGAHTLDVAGTTCARWTVPWRVADDEGTALAAGSYGGGWVCEGSRYYHQGAVYSSNGHGALAFEVR